MLQMAKFQKISNWKKVNQQGKYAIQAFFIVHIGSHFPIETDNIAKRKANVILR